MRNAAGAPPRGPGERAAGWARARLREKIQPSGEHVDHHAAENVKENVDAEAT